MQALKSPRPVRWLNGDAVAPTFKALPARDPRVAVASHGTLHSRRRGLHSPLIWALQSQVLFPELFNTNAQVASESEFYLDTKSMLNKGPKPVNIQTGCYFTCFWGSGYGTQAWSVVSRYIGSLSSWPPAQLATSTCSCFGSEWPYSLGILIAQY